MQYIPDRLLVKTVSQRPVHHPFIRKPLAVKPFPELEIQRIEDIPYLQEPLFHIRVICPRIYSKPSAPVIEMPHEIHYRLTLHRSQILERVLDGLEIGHVGIQTGRIGQILVHIVEIAEYHISPEYEFIQAFRLGVQLPVTPVKFQEQHNPVCSLAPVYSYEKIIYCEHFRGDDRHSGLFSHHLGKVFPEKRHRPPVRENKTVLPAAEREIMASDLL